MLAGDATAAAATRTHNVLPNGTGYWKSTFVSTGASAGQRPNGFLVEQDGSSEIEAHFHKANQFQVFVRGTGTIGKHPVAPVTVHYASAFSPYGPILSDSDGLHYYTLRDDQDPGARFLPADIAELQRTQRRYATSAPALAPAFGPKLAEARLPAIPTEPDGLGAVRIDAPAGAAIEARIGDHLNDRYVLVLAGTLLSEDRVLGQGSCLFLTRSENPGLVAGGGGASLMLMQFPDAGPWRLRDAHQPASP